ncbi:MAG: flagellar biosynthetic protein FliR [Chloroflexi bacterium]|nr:flagellar biosynthetic protein FliR [Chloroflexota bacterium]
MTISVAQAQLFFLAFTRIMAIIIHVPVFGGQSIPNQVRIGLGLALALVLVPWQPLKPDAAVIGTFAFGVSIAKEILIGTLVGFAADLTFGAIQIAGIAMGLGSGFESGRIFNPALGDAGSAFDQIFVILMMMFFLAIDGHHIVLIAMQKTFAVIPVNGPLPFNGMETLALTTAQLITAGIHLALPVMAALILTDLTLGLLARVTPQVQVYFLGLPVKVTVALLSMAMVLAVLLPSLTNLFRLMGENMLLFIQ